MSPAITVLSIFRLDHFRRDNRLQRTIHFFTSFGWKSFLLSIFLMIILLEFKQQVFEHDFRKTPMEKRSI